MKSEQHAAEEEEKQLAEMTSKPQVAQYPMRRVCSFISAELMIQSRFNSLVSASERLFLRMLLLLCFISILTYMQKQHLRNYNLSLLNVQQNESFHFGKQSVCTTQ